MRQAGARPWLTGRLGAVSAAHPLAVAAGQQVLASGGNAADAAIAAQAALCVVLPQSCGVGGDMLCLVAAPGQPVVAVNGTGAAPAGATPCRVANSGGSSVTVPGAVAAWEVLAERFGRCDLRAALDPAAALAAGGISAEPRLLGVVEEQRELLVRGGAGSWELLHASPGQRWVQERLAETLQTIGRDGSEAFYHGLAHGIAAAAQRDGGTLAPADLAAHRTTVTEPLAVDWRGGTVSVQPPVSQGVLLAMALAWLEREGIPDDPGEREHVLVELTEAVFTFRARAAEGAALLAERLEVDRGRARRRGGPRGSLHTAGVAAADADGMVVSSLVTVFDHFGSGVFVPEGGFVLTNRGAGFTVPPNDAAPGKRPVHTLAPALLQGEGETVAVATPGADGQVQTLLQVLVQVATGTDFPNSIAAPRWRSEEGRLFIEDDHPQAAALEVRGHDLLFLDEGAGPFGSVVCAGMREGWPAATGDWRRQVWAGVT